MRQSRHGAALHDLFAGAAQVATLGGAVLGYANVSKVRSPDLASIAAVAGYLAALAL